MKLVSLEILKDKTLKAVSYRDFHLYYVLKGMVKAETDETAFDLESGEMFAMNPGEVHTVNCRKGICADFCISYSRVLQLMGYQRKLIVCNTHNVKNENTEELTETVNRWLKTYYEPSDNLILEESLSLQLVWQLISHFSSNAFAHTEDTRKNEIVSYIEANYADELTLEDISDEFALTPQYFSKYFKAAFGTSFLKYLNGVRLQYALEDLISGSGTILKIAINNGFANVASFNREFREAYGMTPTEYRAVHKSEKQESRKEDVLPLLKEEKEQKSSSEKIIRINAESESGEYRRFWNEILNVGSFEMMMKNHMMDQVTFLHDSLRFRKARLLLDTYAEDGRHHYYVSDAVMEYFVVSHMDVIITIDINYIHDPEAFYSYFRTQCLRLVRRFGDGIRKHTVFELVYDTVFHSENLKKYKSFYQRIRKILSECRLDPELTGPCVLMDETGDNFRKFVRDNPDIRTFTIFSAPFAVHKKGSEVFLNRLTDSGYLMEQYRTAQNVLKEEGRNDAAVLLTAWKDRLNDIDVLNETSYMGARIIRNVLTGYGTLTSLPLDKPLDLMFDEASYDRTFNLLPGILTSQAILKPSYHALKLLDQQDRSLVLVSGECLVTRADNPGYLQILIHNCKQPGWRYYSRDTMDRAEDYSADLFEDSEPRTFHIIIDGLKEGDYLLKSRSVSDEAGSAFAGWLGMKYPDDSFIGHGERDYLRAASVVPVSGGTCHAGKDGRLELTYTLKMNEFRHIHLLKVID
ncbi:MAG: helix-turn-helix domain-containing protein [Solobacterium sp.]|nr:helix-turn-helix domain-containing protein [Solobacterium sp.]